MVLKKFLSYKINGTPVNELPTFKTADLNGNAPFKWVDDSENEPDYQVLCSVLTIVEPGNQSVKLASQFGGQATTDWKQNRDYINTIVEQVGFDNLNDDNKLESAMMNIGTGAQILAAIPNDEERDKSSFNILSQMKGIPSGVRKTRSLQLEGRFWSRLKHEIVDLGGGVTMEAPAFIYGLITIEAQNQIELSGNLLTKYEEAGLQGVAGGDNLLGIYDFILETEGTRFAPFDPVTNPNGGGLVTHPILSALIPSGFADMAGFQQYIIETFIDG